MKLFKDMSLEEAKKMVDDLRVAKENVRKEGKDVYGIIFLIDDILFHTDNLKREYR